jgi:hypothetical protein
LRTANHFLFRDESVLVATQYTEQNAIVQTSVSGRNGSSLESNAEIFEGWCRLRTA